jgi:hypothetical protein
MSDLQNEIDKESRERAEKGKDDFNVQNSAKKLTVASSAGIFIFGIVMAILGLFCPAVFSSPSG